MKPLKILFIFLLISVVCYAEDINWDRLIPAIATVESNNNPNAIGKNGEIGILQISPIVLKEWNNWRIAYWETAYNGKYGVNEEKKEILYEPNTNKIIGTWYLRRLKDHYIPKDKYSVETLLAAYNGGITRLRKNNYDVSKMPKSTQAYIKKVLKCYRRKK